MDMNQKEIDRWHEIHHMIWDRVIDSIPFRGRIDEIKPGIVGDLLGEGKITKEEKEQLYDDCCCALCVIHNDDNGECVGNGGCPLVGCTDTMSVYYLIAHEIDNDEALKDACNLINHIV